MPISEQMIGRLNEQITHEFHASQLYLAMACAFDGMGLKMLSRFFRRQSEEERMHGLKILQFILDVGGEVLLEALPQPTMKFPSVLQAVEGALAHEEKVTEQINAIVAQAETERDYVTRSFLQWFLNEQVEEISTMTHLVQVTRIAKDNLLQLEVYVGQLPDQSKGSEEAES